MLATEFNENLNTRYTANESKYEGTYTSELPIYVDIAELCMYLTS
jgi:hypothetical protein